MRKELTYRKIDVLPIKNVVVVVIWIVLLIVLRVPLQAQVKTTPPAPYGPLPSPQQMAWYKMECNAFIHFTVNTFTGREWGEGSEPETVFHPSSLHTDQWMQVLRQAGFKGVILTAKHHDGFCLWPSRFTTHNISKSPYQQGNGDVVKEAAASAHKAGLKFGVYLSPWDRNAATYGQPEYIQLYRNQMTELLSRYGPLFEFWMDGANGGSGYYGGANGVRKIDGKTYYQWPATIALAQHLQPGILLFSDAGPGLRWCGNEEGRAGDPNWNTITTDTLYPGIPGIENLLQHGDPNGKQWVPAEVDVSIRPGWFYHASEDSLVKTPEQLFSLYIRSVGRGAVLLLNVPPDTTGNLHQQDVQSLIGFKKLIDQRLKHNFAAKANATASTWREGAPQYAATNLTDENPTTYWATDDSITTGSFEINLGKIKTVQYVCLQEYIPLGQRIESFTIDAWQNNTWHTVVTGTTIGYKRILKVEPVQTSRLKVTITKAKACPLVCNVAVY